MTERRIIEVTKPTPCVDPINRVAFERVIDLTCAPKVKATDSAVVRNAIAVAAGICGGCPERVQCLTVHGQDADLGVVGGLGPAQRGVLFGEKSA